MTATESDIWKFDFDPVELKKKYLYERDRRIRNDKQQQYVIVGEGKGEHFKEWLVDPWMPKLEREPMNINTTVLILGGGFSGITTAAKLKDAGVTDFKVIDKAGAYGGNWYWNRYPGAACDSEAYCYLPLLEETGYVPKESYARAPEIREHCARMAAHWKLEENCIFQTQALDIKWDDESKQWVTETDRGDKIVSQFVVTAGGPLHRPKLPDIDGIETFKGHQFHTARWDYAYTGGDDFGNLEGLRDKKVAMIGTGATAIQCVPYLGEYSKHLYVFQRTPSSCDVRNNKPTDPEWAKNLKPGWQKERDLAFQTTLVGGDPKVILDDGFTRTFVEIYSLLKRNQQTGEGSQYTTEELLQLADFRKMEGIRRRVDEIVKDKATAELLKPCYSDTYLQTFNRPNVSIVDTSVHKGIEKVTEKGIVVGGVEYEVDCIVWGTGFDIFGPGFENHSDYKVYGRGGVTKEEKMKDGYASLYGVCTNGFPNYFWYGNTQAAVSTNFPSVFSDQAGFVAHVISETLKRGFKVAEVTVDAEEAWSKEIVDKNAERTTYRSECTPGYYNDEGDISKINKRNLNFGPGPIVYRNILADFQNAGKLEGFQLSK